jgi:ligand-binding sensor domain-containing protein
LRKRAVTLFFFLFFLCSYCCGQTAFTKHFTIKDGLPSNNCYYTLQDANGYIWIASDAGVSRFDGRTFENFSIDDGLPDNQIIRMKQDRSGRIWFSAFNGQLSFFYNGTLFNERNTPFLKLLKFSGVVISFFEDSKGNMWFGTDRNMVARWDGKRLTKYTSANHAEQYLNAFIYEDKAGKIRTSNLRYVNVFDGDKFIRTTPVASSVFFKTATDIPGKTMAFLDKKGLNFGNNEAQKLTLPIPEKLMADHPGYFYVANKNEVWLTTPSGVYHIEGGKAVTKYLQHIPTNQVMKDIHNNMWFTTSDGIYLLYKKENRIYVTDTSQGLSSNRIKSLVKDQDNRLWLGMDNGTINILKSGVITAKIDLPDKNKFQSIKQLSLYPGQNTIFFASDNGLGMIKNAGGKDLQINYLKAIGQPAFILKNFSLSNNGQLAVALSSGVLILNHPLQQRSFNAPEFKEGKNFFSDRAYRVFYDHRQQLWFSSVRGLITLSAGILNRHYRQFPLLTKRINDIVQTADGTVVLATDGYGLLFFKNNKLLKQLTREDGLANNICKRIFISDDHLWVVTSNGINRIYEGDDVVESFEHTNPLLAGDVNELYIDKDTAYFATNHGLVYFAVPPYDSEKNPPKVLISSIISNRRPLNLNSVNITLSPEHNNIMFYFSAIDFKSKNILYRYRLKTTANWTETKSRRLEFSSLEPGKYKFELSAKTNDSQWSKPVSISFTLIGHFWQSAYFIIFLLLIASFTFYKIAVIVTRQQKNKEQKQLLHKNKILMLEQRALQAMMNPHFVFNVMNSIQHYINTQDTSSANKILTGFARLIRKNLDICTRSFITLEEEIEYLTLYLNLEKKRFGEKFNYRISIDEHIDQDERMIPSMLLQPYVENAIWHGLMPKDGGGEIHIRITQVPGGSLMIKIIDNGIGITNSLRVKKAGHESKGMSLTQERINLLNQIEANPIQIDISQDGNSGTVVTVLIPSR